MRIRFAILALSIASCCLASPATAAIANYSDWWWNEQQSGHGLNIGQQGDVLFASWFTYDENGADMWLTMAAVLVGDSASGDLVRSTGPALGTPFDPTSVRRTVVGRGTLTFSSLHAATFAWTVGTRSGSVALTRTTWSGVAPVVGRQQGRMQLDVRGCAGGTTNDLPIASTYTLSGNRLTIVDDFRATGTRVCTMQGTLVPSGSYFKIEDGSYSCVAVNSMGRWTGTLLVRPPFVARDEILDLDGSSCEYHQTTVTAPAPLSQ